MAGLSVTTPSASRLLSMSGPIGSTATIIDPASDYATEGVVGAAHRAQYFAIALSEPALVVLYMQEANTASRCAVFLSCTSTKPTANNASWRLVSPAPVKQLVLHPADPAYRTGRLSIAVQYLEESGQSSFQLRAEVRQDYFAMWLRTGQLSSPRPPATYGHSAKAASSTLHAALLSGSAGHGGHAATAADSVRGGPAAAPLLPAPGSDLFTSLYIGDWHGSQREGLGFQYYAAPHQPAGEEAWAADVQSDEGSDGESCASASSGPANTAASTVPPATTADSLLLLRAFSERHNLPWSAWSIPDTLTPEELATLGFAHTHPTTPTTTVKVNGGQQGSRRDPGASLTAGSSSSPALPPAPPVAQRATAMEGMSELGSVLDRLLLAEFRGVDGGEEEWALLPVQPGVEVYAGEWAANRKDGRGFYQWLDRSYAGEWVAGRREGFGTLRRKDGSWYRGQWERHVPHGTGEARLMPVKLRYSGEWRRGRRSGQGSLAYPDGTVVHGTWVADVLQPEVHTVYPDGTTYDGTWSSSEACRDGPGTFTDATGCQHIHVWSHNARTGPGREVYPNGVTREGVWQDDCLTEGVYVFANGDRYVGGMDAALHVREGTGTCTSADGLSVYTGGWAKDKRSGHGVFVRYEAAPMSAGGPHTDDSGCEGGGADRVVVERYEGEWCDGQRSGRGSWQCGDEVYEGSFVQDCRDGVGAQRHTRTGSFYEGHWKRDRRCGAGTYFSATKNTTYDGVFLHDRLTGPGTATNAATSEQYTGHWLDGVEQGGGTLRLANGDTLRGVWHRGLPEPDTSVEYVKAATGGAARDSRYVGGWRDGARHGAGTQVFGDGSVYEGAWERDRPHGRGRRTAASGESVDCEWRDGGIAPGSAASVCFVDGSVYVGQVSGAGVPHGAGVLTYPDGTVFDGHFEDGIYQL